MFPVAPPVEGRSWLSTPPIAWQTLRGQVVVVVFWSFGCEASLLAVRRLTELARRWPEGVTVVAVHTPRFPYEDDADRVDQAVARHRIELPVVHDPDYITWNRYNPGGWPASAVIDRDGRVIGMNAGISGTEVIEEAVALELAKPASGRRRGSERAGKATATGKADPARAGKATAAQTNEADTAQTGKAGTAQTGKAGTAQTGKADPARAGKGSGRPSADGSTLRFPSAVALTPAGLLIVADSGHDRILVGRLDADLRTFKPEIEITDIDNPTALACASDSVFYVVERGTGSVLQVDMEHGTLDVLADDDLAAPTALLVDGDGSVVVADAGYDQLFRIAGGPDGDVVIGVIAGAGFSGCRDGDAARAQLAQPAGLARTSAGLVFCDAASSNLRLLTDGGKVFTITGNDFFDWGLVDGPAQVARLQRPGGLCVDADGSVLIADTGNDRIRLLEDRNIRTLGLGGLNQPTGLAALGSGHIVIADTGNHRLVVADPARKTGWPLAVYPAMMTSVWDTASGAV